MIRLISDRPLKYWELKMVDLMNEWEKLHIDGVAVLAITDREKDGMPMTAKYINLRVSERMMLKGQMEYDIACTAAENEIEDYMGTGEEKE